MEASDDIEGQVAHFLVTGVLYLRSLTSGEPAEISTRGDELSITSDLIEANTDRTGRCWLNLLHDPVGQTNAFGRPVLAPGPRPDGMLSTEPGTADHESARHRELAKTMELPGPEQKAARATVKVRYGPAPTTSRTLATYGPAGD